MSIRIAISGAAGRMGRRIIALAAADSSVKIVYALETAESKHIGADAGQLAGIAPIGVAVAASCAADFDVLVDFSSVAGTAASLDACVRTARPIVIGTTGHAEAELAKIHEAAKRIAVVKAANMSVGVNVLLRLVRTAAAMLDESYDVEIVEAHHRFKVDAPSGTALALKEAVRTGRAREARVVHGRQGRTGERSPGEIGMHALRLGDTVGEHSVSFAALGETVTLAHSAHSRDTFAAGALRAARWLVQKPPGLYTMEDVLFA